MIFEARTEPGNGSAVRFLLPITGSVLAAAVVAATTNVSSAPGA